MLRPAFGGRGRGGEGAAPPALGEACVLVVDYLVRVVARGPK